MPRHPKLAESTSTLSSTVFSNLKEKARHHRGPLYPLHVGDTWLEPLPAGRAEAQRTADHGRLHNYAPIHGEPELLQAISERLERRSALTIPPDNIQVMSGATGGLSVVCETVLEPGDEVLLPAPYWPLIRGCIASRSATPVEIPFFDRIGSSDFDPERALEEQITDRTAAVYVNTPHNPTGRALPRDVVDVVARVALRHNLWILCDETYEELWYGDGPYEPVWGRFDVQPNAIAVHTMSKAYGLAGARVGWAHGPEEVVQKLRGVQTFQTYCAPRPMQFGAARTLREGDRWLAEARRLYRHSGNAAADALGIPHPEGGTFLMFDASPYLRPEDETCMPFLERCLEAGVMLTPGGSCGGDYARWARLCFTSVPPEDLQEALRRLRTVLDGSA